MRRRPKQHVRRVRTKHGRKAVTVNRGVKGRPQRPRRFLGGRAFADIRERGPPPLFKQRQDELEFVEKALTIPDLHSSRRSELELQRDALLKALNPNPVAAIKKGFRRKSLFKSPHFRQKFRRLEELEGRKEPLRDFEILEFLDKRQALDEIARKFRREQRKAVNDLNKQFVSKKMVRRKAPEPGPFIEELYFNQFKKLSAKKGRPTLSKLPTRRSKEGFFDVDELLERRDGR